MKNTAESPILDPLSLEVLSLLEGADPEIAENMAKEAKRQQYTLELIASENHVHYCR